KTLGLDDVKIALELNGIEFGSVINNKTFKIAGIKQEKREKPKENKSKPGMAALREIRRQQKDTTLSFPREAFLRLIKEILGDFTDGESRVSKEAALVLQSAVETYLLHLYLFAYKITLSSGRTGISVKDISLAYKNNPKSLLCINYM